jgi:hypothetical protein
LRSRHAARQKLDQVARIEDGRWIEGFPRCFYGHGSFDEIEGAGDAVFLERARYEGPGFAQVDFAVFGEEGCEGGFFGEGPAGVVGGCEGVDLGLLELIGILGDS